MGCMYARGKNERGATAVEYGLIVATLLAALIAIGPMRVAVMGVFDAQNQQVECDAQLTAVECANQP
jgi:Flp pilus assembly pilin Flp